MVNGNMWFDTPELSKPVPISQRQRLLGKAAYGDIAATNYAYDYNATLMGEENIDGEDCFAFDLKSKDKRATYEQDPLLDIKKTSRQRQGGLLHRVGKKIKNRDHALRQPLQSE